MRRATISATSASDGVLEADEEAVDAEVVEEAEGVEVAAGAVAAGAAGGSASAVDSPPMPAQANRPTIIRMILPQIVQVRGRWPPESRGHL
jgi:hypothetical protein